MDGGCVIERLRIIDSLQGNNHLPLASLTRVRTEPGRIEYYNQLYLSMWSSWG